MPSMASRFGTRGLWHPNGWNFGGGSSGSISAHSSSETAQRLVVVALVIA